MKDIRITREKKGLGHLGAERAVRNAIRAAMRAEGVDVPYEVEVVFTDDEGIREVNLAQRDVDRATDVLSFPVNELIPGSFDAEACDVDMETGAVMLGDMVISLPRCEAQGAEYGNGFTREISYLAVHSSLHLLGYDHVDEGEDKKLMRSREEAVMDRLGMGYSKERTDGDN